MKPITPPVFETLRADPRFQAELARLRGRQDELRRRLPDTFRRHGLAWPPSPPARTQNE